LDSDLEQVIGWVQEFNQESQKNSQVVSLEAITASQVTVSIENIEPAKAGVCITFEGGGPKKLQLNALHWPTLTETQKQLVVFHELGHCILNRDHKADLEDRLGYYQAVSIMHPAVLEAISPDTFAQYRSDYYSELFGRSPNMPFVAYIRESLLGAELFAAFTTLSKTVSGWLTSDQSCLMAPPTKTEAAS